MLSKSQHWNIHQQHHLWVSITYEVKVEQSSRGGDDLLKYQTLWICSFKLNVNYYINVFCKLVPLSHVITGKELSGLSQLKMLSI